MDVKTIFCTLRVNTPTEIVQTSGSEWLTDFSGGDRPRRWAASGTTTVQAISGSVRPGVFERFNQEFKNSRSQEWRAVLIRREMLVILEFLNS